MLDVAVAEIVEIGPVGVFILRIKIAFRRAGAPGCPRAVTVKGADVARTKPIVPCPRTGSL
jgi:hypothetical protein